MVLATQNIVISSNRVRRGNGLMARVEWAGPVGSDMGLLLEPLGGMCSFSGGVAGGLDVSVEVLVAILPRDRGGA